MPPPLFDAGSLAPALEAGAAALGLPLTSVQRDQLLQYLGLLVRWNATYNLTAVRQPDQMLTHHLLDCLAVVPALAHSRPATARRLLDVGSGGGLPGVVLAIMEPSLSVTCVDTVGKKAAFVRQVGVELGLRNLRAVHARVEQLTERFDLISSRAFATLAQMCAWTRGSLAEQGVWMAMKGQHPADEIAELPPDIEVFHVEQLQVPGLDADRCLVWMRLKSSAHPA
jgi:16S rRNA (guanine527-N7)-methyltransferase